MPTADYSSYHQPSGTGADGTKYGNFIDAVQATVNALDKNNLAAAAGILPSQLADPTTGKVLGSSGSACAAVFPPGYEFDRDTNTTGTTVTATTVGTANTVITGHSVVYDGSPVYVDFSAYAMAKGTTYCRIGVYVDGTQQGEIIHYLHATTGPACGRIRITPAAGAHTISIRAYVDAGSGSVFAAAGGSGNPAPNEMTVRKV